MKGRGGRKTPTTNPVATALRFAAEREAVLRVFLEDPEVSVDTNHLERGLRPIPSGAAQLVVCLDRAGRPTNRRDPKPSGDVQASRGEPLRFIWSMCCNGSASIRRGASSN